MADFRSQLKDTRQKERLEELDRKLDKAIGKDLDATLVPNYGTSDRAKEMEAEGFPELEDLNMSEADHVKFTLLLNGVVEIMGQQVKLAQDRKRKMHDAKKLAHKYGIDKVLVNGHRFRLWPM